MCLHSVASFIIQHRVAYESKLTDRILKSVETLTETSLA